MAFAVLPHTEIVNYTKGLMLLHVPRTLALCFMMTTVKTRSVLKLSWSSPPLLQFYLSCPFKERTKACSRSCTSHVSQCRAFQTNDSPTHRYETTTFIIIVCVRWQRLLKEIQMLSVNQVTMQWHPKDLKMLLKEKKTDDRSIRREFNLSYLIWHKHKHRWVSTLRQGHASIQVKCNDLIN